MNTQKKDAPRLTGKMLAEAAGRIADDQKAEDITIVKLDASIGSADWFVICHADNSQHTRAIAENLISELKAEGIRPWLVEGLESSRWVLIDYSDVIVHVMLDEVRDFYNIEELWGATRKIVAKKSRSSRTEFV
jgi:ribosome-associated protein